MECAWMNRSAGGASESKDGDGSRGTMKVYAGIAIARRGRPTFNLSFGGTLRDQDACEDQAPASSRTTRR